MSSTRISGRMFLQVMKDLAQSLKSLVAGILLLPQRVT